MGATPHGGATADVSTKGQKEESACRRNLAILAAILIIDLTAFACILPLFPTILDFYASRTPADPFHAKFEWLVRQLQHGLRIPTDVHRYNNVFLAGILGSLFSLLQYVSSPILGALSDVYGRKPVLIVSLLGSLMSYHLWFVADTFGVFVASRAVGGLSKASVSVAIAVVADLLPPHRRGAGMALVGVSFSVAFIVGPMLGAYFAATAVGAALRGASAARFAVAATAVELALVAALLPESLNRTSSASRTKYTQLARNVLDYVSPWRLFRFSAAAATTTKAKADTQSRLLRAYGNCYFGFLFLFSALEFTLCFLTHLRFGYGGVEQGRLYLFAGLLMIGVQGGYVRRLASDDRTQRRAVGVGLAAIVPAYALISLAFREPLLYAGLTLYSLASAIVVPCLTTLVSNCCPAGTRGETLGVFRSIGALARAVGPIFGAFLFWLIGPTLSYALGAFLLLGPLLFFRRLSSAIDKDIVDSKNNHLPPEFTTSERLKSQ